MLVNQCVRTRGAQHIPQTRSALSHLIIVNSHVMNTDGFVHTQLSLHDTRLGFGYLFLVFYFHADTDAHDAAITHCRTG